MIKESINKHVGNQLLLRRKTLGLGQRQLAKSVGVSLRQIQKYEQGLNKIGSDMLYTLAKVLDVTILYFFDELSCNELNYHNYVKDHCNEESKEMITQLIAAFISLPTTTQNNIFKLITNIASENSSELGNITVSIPKK